MRANLDILFNVALIALFAATLLAAQGFRSQARLFPIVIGIAGLAFAVLQLVLAVRQRRAATAARSAPSPDEGPLGVVLPPGVRERRTAAILGWILGAALCVWLIGFFLTVPLLTLAYLKVGARERWPVSLALAIGAGLVFYGLFGYAVRIPFEDGYLISLLAG